ncbi:MULTISPECIES: hypothetical protein [unclassified Brevundimonas]|jgi:hypothetical protein|uniref:hypothetical protein n=1 Tax=unclassified Brevundimonas TaxID=2622653 RepID=UPI000C5C35D4|nr:MULTISPECIES: hypothetical protein [unclassified Brevundimonas]MAL88378.1 hypothetical protein [Brevundimonas sp.]HAJ02390.1 hypothetical protein [Brevundimonas sp.]|tara:strand:+ start:4496 stop:5020 length:525 start_codon:yes stop_codon:yes gene_type:complete
MRIAKSLTLGLGLALAVSLTSGMAMAQDTDAPPSETAAASLPNAFDGTPRPAPPVAVQETPTAEAPDVTRARETLEVVIADAQDGSLDFSAFSEDMTNRLRPVEGDLTAAIQSFGALETIAHVGHQNGADMFEVRFESILTQWVIGFDAEDRIAVLLFREAPPAEAAPAPASGS